MDTNLPIKMTFLHASYFLDCLDRGPCTSKLAGQGQDLNTQPFMSDARLSGGVAVQNNLSPIDGRAHGQPIPFFPHFSMDPDLAWVPACASAFLPRLGHLAPPGVLACTRLQKLDRNRVILPRQDHSCIMKICKFAVGT